jgi:hypothetical protein
MCDSTSLAYFAIASAAYASCLSVVFLKQFRELVIEIGVPQTLDKSWLISKARAWMQPLQWPIEPPVQDWFSGPRRRWSASVRQGTKNPPLSPGSGLSLIFGSGSFAARMTSCYG